MKKEERIELNSSLQRFSETTTQQKSRLEETIGEVFVFKNENGKKNECLCRIVA